jgi:hypothetical protein
MVTAKPPAAGAARRYYLTQKPAPDARSITYVAGYENEERTTRMAAAWIERSDVAPQTKIAAKFKPIFAQEPARIDWEAGMADLLDRIRSQPEMDPVLQVALLRKVLELAVAGSEPLRQSMSALKNLVDSADVDVNALWMDPENKSADRVRARAALFIRSLPDLTGPRKEAIGRRARIDRLVSRRPRAIGWLAHDTGGWRVRTGSLPPVVVTLEIVVPGPVGRGAWRAVGTIKDGRPQFLPDAESSLAEGRPVFAAPPDAGGP